MKLSPMKLLYAFILIVLLGSLFIDPFDVFMDGLKQIIVQSDVLVSDYFEIGGIGASLFNASLLAMGSVLLIRISKAPMNGYVLTSVMMMAGFGLFGKNIVNVIPIILGTYIYSYYRSETFGDVVHIGLFSPSFSPIVTEIMFVIDMDPTVRVILAVAVGMSVGFIITPISRHLFRVHKGFSLYNIGFSIGLLSTLYVSLMKSYGFITYQRLILSSGNNQIMSVFLVLLFFLTFAYGAYYTDFKFARLRMLFKESGYGNNDFIVKYGLGTSMMNMAINGLVAWAYVVFIAKGQLNGPSIGGILTVYGFGGLGKHARNILPIFVGVYLGGITQIWDIHETSGLFAALFGTALAPVAGRFGFIMGVIVSFVNSSVVLNSGILHGGMNLYNTGFSAGLVAAVLLPLMEMIQRKRTGVT